MLRPLFIVGASLMLSSCAAADDAAAAFPGRIELVCVDEEATGYATFQSHNQKVVANRHGIFMSHIRSRNEPYTAPTGYRREKIPRRLQVSSPRDKLRDGQSALALQNLLALMLEDRVEDHARESCISWASLSRARPESMA